MKVKAQEEEKGRKIMCFLSSFPSPRNKRKILKENCASETKQKSKKLKMKENFLERKFETKGTQHKINI